MRHIQRGLLHTFSASALSLALCGAALAQTSPAPPPVAPATAPVGRPLEGGPDFISPVGEPYRSEDKLSGAEHWFAIVDTDHDGRISWAEFKANANRFFQRLDADHNGMIEPDEIERYESQIAPEIRVISTGFDAPANDDDSNKQPYPDRLGAGRYSYIDLPEPIVAMDTNFDRAISPAEFSKATQVRFNALDQNHDGFLTRDELPKLTPIHDQPGERRRGGGSRGGRGHGGHGGMGGMGAGGMGGPGGGMSGTMGGPGGMDDGPQ